MMVILGVSYCQVGSYGAERLKSAALHEEIPKTLIKLFIESWISILVMQIDMLPLTGLKRICQAV